MKIERLLSQDDAAALSRLAEQLLRVREVKVNAADRLIELIATAILLPADDVRRDYVTLNSTVTCRLVGTGEHRTIQILCPRDANDTLAKASILTPTAISLLGRRVGSIVEISLPFSQVQYVEIVDVSHNTSPDSGGGKRVGLPGFAQ